MAFNIDSTPIKKLMLNDQKLKKLWVDNTLVFRDEIYIYWAFGCYYDSDGQEDGVTWDVASDVLSSKNAAPSPTGRYTNRCADLEQKFKIEEVVWGNGNYPTVIYPSVEPVDYERPLQRIAFLRCRGSNFYYNHELKFTFTDYPDYPVILRWRTYSDYEVRNPIVDVILPDGTSYQLYPNGSSVVSFFVPVPNRY